MSDTIRMFDYLPSYQPLAAEYQRKFEQVLQSGRLILGPETEALETELAQYLGAAHCVAVQSGTAALLLSLMSLGVGHGDEVITVANTCAPTASAICMSGAQPVFAEVLPDTLMMNPASVASLIGPKTAAIIAVHLWGNAVDMTALHAVAQAAGIPIIEDCAQAFGTRIGTQAAGTLGQLGCLSFYPTKNLGAFGDGGAIITDDADLARLAGSMRLYGYEGSQFSERVGTNGRINELQAGILRIKLGQFEQEFARRLDNAANYRNGIEAVDGIDLPATTTGVRHAYHQFVVRCQDREAVQHRLAANDIESGVHYPVPLHRMPAFADARHHGLAITEAAGNEVLSLPVHENLADDAVERVLRVLTGSS